MKKILLTCCLLVAGSLAFAQTTYEVTTIAQNSATEPLANVRGLDIDGDGNIIAAARNSHAIRKVTLPAFGTSTVAGFAGTTGYVDDADPANARFKSPVGVAIDGFGNIYIAEANHVIRKIALVSPGVYGAVTTIAGTFTVDGGTGVSTGVSGSDDNVDPLQAKFNGPIDIRITATGDLFVTDNNGVRKIAVVSPGVYGEVSTLATGFGGIMGQLVFDSNGDILVITTTDGLVRVNKTNGTKTTVVAGGGAGTIADDGTLSTGKLGSAYGLARNSITGDIYVMQTGTSYVRRINIAEDVVESVLGGIKSGNNAPIDGVGIVEAAEPGKTLARFNSPQGGVVAPDGTLYVGDTNNSSIREVVITTAPLPVDLISFTAKLDDNKVNIDWITASEKNSSRFEILRSENGSDFAVIGSVEALGDSNAKKYYSFKDDSPLAGIGYYQLRQIDKDGKSKIYATQAVKFGLQQSFLKVFTSVSNATVKVFASLEVGGNASLTITDIQGRSVFTNNVVLAAGQSEISLPISLTSGLYVATLKLGSEVMVTKFVAQ